MEETARIILTSAGINPEDGTAVIARIEEIKRTPKLRCVAVILGLLPAEEPGDSRTMIQEAQNDPILWAIPSPEKLKVCFERAAHRLVPLGFHAGAHARGARSGRAPSRRPKPLWGSA